MIKAKTIKELAINYGVSRDTMVVWLEEYDLLKLRIGRLFPPSAVCEIYRVLGNPNEYK